MLKIIRYFLSKIAVNTMVSLFHQACFVFQIYFDISSKVVNDNLQTTFTCIRKNKSNF